MHRIKALAAEHVNREKLVKFSLDELVKKEKFTTKFNYAENLGQQDMEACLIEEI